MNASLRRAAWQKGYLEYRLRPSQRGVYRQFYASPSRKFVAKCSRRWGKTDLLATISDEIARRKPGAIIRLAAPTQKQLRTIILPTFRTVHNDCPRDLRPVWLSQESKFHYPNGSDIYCSGVDKDPDALRGTSADLCGVEEAGMCSNLDYVVRDVLMPQLLTTGGRLMMISSAAVTPAHDFTTFCDEAKTGGWYAEKSIYEAGYAPDLIEEFCEEAGGPNSTTWKREYLNMDVVDEERALCPEWKPDFEAAVERPKTFHLLHKYVAMDIGVSDLTACLYGWYDFEHARLVIEDETCMNGPAMTTDKLADSIRAKELDLWNGQKVFLRISDNNNLILVNDLGSDKHGIPFLPTDKDNLEAMVNKVRIMVKQGRVVVNPRCKMLIGCLRSGIWTENRQKFDRSKVYGHFDHFAALMYLIRNLDEHTNPVPASYGFTYDKAMIHHVKPEEHLALEKAFGMIQ